MTDPMRRVSPDVRALADRLRPRLQEAADGGEPDLVLADDADLLLPDGGFWVFAYGSLIWNPGFPVAERRPAQLRGHHRGFHLWSMHYRGTPEAPGLVLGLAEQPDAVTDGVAFRVAPEDAPSARGYLAARELVSAAYWERAVTIETRAPCGTREAAPAVTYVCDPEHRQFATGLSLEEQAAVIADSIGPSGENSAYLDATLEHLRAEGLSEAALGDLPALEILVRRLLADGAAGETAS